MVCIMANGRELHFMGEGMDGVVVAWNLDKSGAKSGEPYIDFSRCRCDPSDGSFWEDEDNCATGGMNVNTALKLYREILQATQYVEGLRTHQKL